MKSFSYTGFLKFMPIPTKFPLSRQNLTIDFQNQILVLMPKKSCCFGNRILMIRYGSMQKLFLGNSLAGTGCRNVLSLCGKIMD